MFLVNGAAKAGAVARVRANDPVVLAMLDGVVHEKTQRS
jgi:hypothetical protein